MIDSNHNRKVGAQVVDGPRAAHGPLEHAHQRQVNRLSDPDAWAQQREPSVYDAHPAGRKLACASTPLAHLLSGITVTADKLQPGAWVGCSPTRAQPKPSSPKQLENSSRQHEAAGV